MHRAYLRGQRRFPCLLVALGLLLVLVPGCGEEPIQKDESAGGVPKVLKDSNDRMEAFMKSQAAAKKK
jgi:hypothetical protein